MSLADCLRRVAASNRLGAICPIGSLGNGRQNIRPWSSKANGWTP